jgi:endonuclease/exonuclease/phosphatase family metal-dependent hydrolase
MTSTSSHDLSVLSWNILAPCWIYKEWYPTLFDLAADEQSRLKLIIEHIQSFNHDIIMIQEAQEDRLFLFKEKLGDDYFFEFAPNNPTPSPNANGLLTLIRKNYSYASEIKIINGILDLERGDAIQIISIPSRNLYFLNIHIDFFHRVVQAKMLHDRCTALLGIEHSISLMAGDFNAEIKDHYEFEWIDYENVFSEPSKYAQIFTYYGDPEYWSNMTLDHILYNPNQLEPIAHGKAWDTSNHTLEEALKTFGSDHIYVWATFRFRQNPTS